MRISHTTAHSKLQSRFDVTGLGRIKIRLAGLNCRKEWVILTLTLHYCELVNRNMGNIADFQAGFLKPSQGMTLSNAWVIAR